jgi:hypothetical protein
MYARFLETARPGLVPLCQTAAGRWSELARELTPARALACAEAEDALWSRAARA